MVTEQKPQGSGSRHVADCGQWLTLFITLLKNIHLL